MLDNMVGEELHGAAKELKQKWKAQGREFLIETSGGIVEGSLTGRIGPGASAISIVTQLIDPDIDILSTSAVHQVSLLQILDRAPVDARQSCPHVDFSLKIQPKSSGKPSA